MSRRGNCWDNAPQESYFGHMKDELNLDTCFTFRDVCNEIKDCTTTCTKVDKIDSSKVSEYEITYSVNYLGSIHTELRYVHIKGDSE